MGHYSKTLCTHVSLNVASSEYKVNMWCGKASLTLHTLKKKKKTDSLQFYEQTDKLTSLPMKQSYVLWNLLRGHQAVTELKELKISLR